MSERESMPYDVVIVGAGPGRARRRDPPQAARRRGRARALGLHPRKGLRSRRAHPLGRGGRSARARRTAARLEGAGQPAHRAGHREPALGADRAQEIRHAALADAALHEQQGHLHRVARQSLPLARRAGRGAGRRDLPRLRRRRDPVQRRRRGEGRRHRRHGRRRATAPTSPITSPAWSCTANTPSSPRARAATSPRS